MLFIFGRRSVHAFLYEVVAPVQRFTQRAWECALPQPRSHVRIYPLHSCGSSTLCRQVVSVARLTCRGRRKFYRAPNAAFSAPSQVEEFCDASVGGCNAVSYVTSELSTCFYGQVLLNFWTL